VNTWSGTETLRYNVYGDKSPFLDKITEFNVTRIDFYKKFEFTDPTSESIYNHQKDYFRNSNSWRDAQHDFTEDLAIPGYHGGGLASLDGTFPSWMTPGTYILCCLFFLELAYQYKFRTATGKKAYTFIKIFGCAPPLIQTVIVQQPVI